LVGALFPDCATPPSDEDLSLGTPVALLLFIAESIQIVIESELKASIQLKIETRKPDSRSFSDDSKYRSRGGESMRVVLRTLLICLLAPAAVALAQDKTPTAAAQPPANPYSGFVKGAYGIVKNNLVLSAEKVPEEDYSFKPTDAVRSFGQIIGHVADAQYMFCSMALGEKNPAPNIEKTKTTKADLVAALNDSVAYCNKAYSSMTDSSGAEMVTLFGMNMPRLGVLMVNNMHDMEHYGNLVTYMRMKNIVPPSSTPPPQAQQKSAQPKD
jgi:uncharacterized damage-inducible protein DinB